MIKIPKDKTETEVINIIIKVSKKLSKKYNIPGFEPEDIEQECFIWAIEAMDNYNDATTSIDTFLYIHFKNRILNMIRKFDRQNEDTDRPTIELNRNQKKSLLCPKNIDDSCDNIYYETEYYSDDIKEIIDKYLPVEQRETYLKLISGVKISPCKKMKLQQIVRQILKENGVH